MPKKLFTMIITLEVIIGGLALAYIFSTLWHKPLGPSMEMPNQVSGLIENSSGTSVIGPQSGGAVPEPMPTPSSLFAQIAMLVKRPNEINKSLCGGPSVMTILVVGSDERENDYLYGLADSIRIIRIDFTIPKVMILDIPRDLWVDIPDIIDSIGGIDIQLSSLIDMNQGQDGANPDLVLDAGLHHLDGDMALKLAVYRFPSIFQRARYQNIVLMSLQDKLLSPSMIPELPQLITQFTGSVQTDLSPSDINQLICIGQALTQENTDIVAFPDEMFISGSTYDPYRQVNTFTLSVDMDLFHEYIVDFMNGTWPRDQGLTQ